MRVPPRTVVPAHGPALNRFTTEYASFGARIASPAVSAIRIRDTLSGETRDLHVDGRGEVGIYACGPTVYGRIHIGNARPYVVFTLLKRFLEHEGLDAKLVINVTDINDKIYDAAKEAGEPSAKYAAEMTDAYVADTDALGLPRPDAEPLASETIGEIVSLIQALIDSGHAYQANGDVYFRVRSFDDYGKLSNRDPDEMDQGEEAGTASLKEDPLDFALWKGHKEGEDTSWDSPWGQGRPGWHIECSAMSEKELGTDFAIHGGGIDLAGPGSCRAAARLTAVALQVTVNFAIVVTEPPSCYDLDLRCPRAPAGTVTVSCVSDTTVNDVAGVIPKRTAVMSGETGPRDRHERADGTGGG